MSITHYSPNVDWKKFRNCYVGCVVLAHDGRIVMQYRDESFKSFPGYLGMFGGRMEDGEVPLLALVRELKEELGADVVSNEPVSIGAFTEDETNHQDLIFAYFWHDHAGTISGCWEGEARYFANLIETFAYTKILDGDRWMLYECQRLGLIK